MSAPAVNLRDARRGDLEAMARVEREAFDDAWTAADLAPRIGRADHLLLVAERAGAVVGYALFQRAGGEAELQRIGVVSADRGRGLGARLLREGLGRLRATGDCACFLEVREGNSAARRLYSRAGFALLGRRRGYYPNGEDALVYRLEL